MISVTGTVAPSGYRRLTSVPSSGASTSMLTLSVVTSQIGSPRRTVSPSCLSHFTMSADSSVNPNFGRITGMGIDFPEILIFFTANGNPMKHLLTQGLVVRATWLVEVVQVTRHVLMNSYRIISVVLLDFVHLRSV